MHKALPSITTKTPMTIIKKPLKISRTKTRPRQQTRQEGTLQQGVYGSQNQAKLRDMYGFSNGQNLATTSFIFDPKQMGGTNLSTS